MHFAMGWAAAGGPPLSSGTFRNLRSKALNLILGVHTDSSLRCAPNPKIQSSKPDFWRPNGFSLPGDPSIEVGGDPRQLMGFPEGRDRLDPKNSTSQWVRLKPRLRFLTV